jgi:hypothetical protein
MQFELQELDDEKVIFKGLLYTKELVYWSSLVYEDAQKKGHKDPWLVADKVIDKKYNKQRLLFLSTEESTKDYKDKFLKINEFKERLMIMRSVLTDERIPSSVIHEWCEEGKPYPCGNSYDFYYKEEFGRNWILDKVKEYQDYSFYIL